MSTLQPAILPISRYTRTGVLRGDLHQPRSPSRRTHCYTPFSLLTAILAAGSMLAAPPARSQSSLPSASVIDSGLVAWYPFDGNAKDASGNGNHGRVTGLVPTANRAGSKASALLFTGRTDTVFLPASSDFDFSTSRALSVGIWVRLPSTSGGASFAVGGGGGGGTICRHFSAQLQVEGMEVSATVLASECRIVVKGSLRPGTSPWHHLMLTVDDVALSLFIDGAQVGQRAVYDMKWDTPAMAGWRLTGFSNARSPAGIAIDDLRLYRRRLTPAEATLLFLSSPM